MCYQSKSEDLDKVPVSLEDLKFVLTTISDIKAMSLDVEDKIRDIQERYRTLSMYDIEVCTTFPCTTIKSCRIHICNVLGEASKSQCVVSCDVYVIPVCCITCCFCGITWCVCDTGVWYHMLFVWYHMVCM